MKLMLNKPLRGQQPIPLGLRRATACLMLAALLWAGANVAAAGEPKAPPLPPGVASATTRTTAKVPKAKHEKAHECKSCHKPYAKVTFSSNGKQDALAILKNPFYSNRPELVKWAKDVLAFDKQCQKQRAKEARAEKLRRDKAAEAGRLRSPKDRP